jgi:hypothetical protein
MMLAGPVPVYAGIEKAVTSIETPVLLDPCGSLVLRTYRPEWDRVAGMGWMVGFACSPPAWAMDTGSNRAMTRSSARTAGLTAYLDSGEIP